MSKEKIDAGPGSFTKEKGGMQVHASGKGEGKDKLEKEV